jgi:ankyrin repeat protein
MAEMLLAHGADANAWACVWNAYRQKDAAMIELLARYGGVPNAMTPGYLRDTELAARMFRQEDAGTLPKGTVREGRTVAEEILDPAASAGSVDILRMALERIAWPTDDPRWWGILASPLCFWNHIPWIYSEKWDLDRNTYLPCFAIVLDRCDANIRGRFGITVLHYAAASYDWVTPEERVAFVRILLDRGARMDVRDELLQSTPLGWACRWGRLEVAKLLLERGADPVEPDAELWTTPHVWAEKAGHKAIVAVLQEYAPRK